MTITPYEVVGRSERDAIFARVRRFRSQVYSERHIEHPENRRLALIPIFRVIGIIGMNGWFRVERESGAERRADIQIKTLREFKFVTAIAGYCQVTGSILILAG
jgi:hypothetical protein